MDYEVVYKAFLSKMTDDVWASWEEYEVYEDLRTLLEAAIPRFKFPLTSLDRDDNGFTSPLNNQEIEILASYMKVEWLNRTVLSWENIRPLYEERDFSQANLLHRFTVLLESEDKRARRLESLYYRAANHTPYQYGKLAGGNK